MTHTSGSVKELPANWTAVWYHRLYASFVLDLDVVETLTYRIADMALCTDPMQGIGSNMGTIASDRVTCAIWKTVRDVWGKDTRLGVLRF